MSHNEPRDWQVLWGTGDLTIRIRSGTQLGEDEAGEICFRRPANGCWIEFTIDDDDCLWVASVDDAYRISQNEGACVDRIRLEPGTQIDLPNNQLHIATNIRRTTSSGVVVKLTKTNNKEPLKQPELAPKPSAASNQQPEDSSMHQPSGSLEDLQPAPLNRYKWFLLGPLLGILILIAMTIWVAFESVPS